jgi:hypothetical protein
MSLLRRGGEFEGGMALGMGMGMESTRRCWGQGI